MAGQESQEQRRGQSAEDVEKNAKASDLADRKHKIDEDVDALLDEIDDVLEENAEEFVRSFVQKGGQ